MSQAKINQAAIRLFAEKGSSQVSISELAQAAGVARGTIYNNYPETETLFEEIAAQLASDMHERIGGSAESSSDPARSLANGLRYFVKQAHDEPQWGRFILRFAFSNAALQDMWRAQPSKDLMSGLECGRFRFAPEQAASVLSMIAGTALSAMFMVLQGYKTWRDAGSDTAEYTLRALGIEPEEAHRIANMDLPPLPR
ncbi:MAG: TetR family transcriptional regulator [Rhizobium sp.]|nr:TetR family transcriptional regulator [Rhizobium sp.]